MTLPEKLLVCYLLLINALGLLFMYADKRRAKKRRRRIPEATLMAVAALGGRLGSWAGMYAFRHKTRHPKFYLGVPALLLAQAALGWLLLRQ